MSTNSMDKNDVQKAFADLVNFENQEEKHEHKTQLLAFKFLSEIDEAMEKQNMKKKELAKKVGTSPAYITQLFMGDRNPNFSIIQKMAEALDIEFYVNTKEKHLRQYYSPRADKDGMWVYRKNEVKNEPEDFNYELDVDYNAMAI
jgi:ribosome-binding protein aMBF1 (putative translation factor)